MKEAANGAPYPSFHLDPVGFAERAFAAEGDVFFLPGRQLCVAEPALARAVLANREGLYAEHSDFFHTRRGVFGSREVEARWGRESRSFCVRSCASSRRAARPHEVAGHPVTPRDLVVVCPYLIHRHPRFWAAPSAFRPERWMAPLLASPAGEGPWCKRWYPRWSERLKKSSSCARFGREAAPRGVCSGPMKTNSRCSTPTRRSRSTASTSPT